MSVKEQIAAILKEIKPTKDLSAVEDIIEGGYLDSFELMSLISNLGEAFEIEIDVDDIIPENFNSIENMVNMVENIKAR